MRLTKRFITPAFIMLLILQACGGSFTQNFRLALLAAPPVVESLPLSAALKSGLITDFTDMAGDVLDLSSCLKAGPDKPADLICVQSLDSKVEIIIARGHFAQANHPKLQRILDLIRGIIASARIYYGGGSPTLTGRGISEKEAGETIRVKLDELKAAMK